MNDPGGKYVPGTTRLRNTEFTYPIVVGTAAFHLGKKASDTATHKWCVFVRGVNHEDISHVVQKVTFQLHETFNQAHRTIPAPPFEVVEVGWGEFEIIVHLHFPPESGERNIQLVHRLKLFPDEDAPPLQEGQPVLSEVRHELVFSEPAEAWYAAVINHVARATPRPSEVERFTPRGDAAFAAIEAAELATIASARAKVAAFAHQYQQQLENMGGGMGMGMGMGMG